MVRSAGSIQIMNQLISIDHLNILFISWLESDYHRNPHREINNQTPLECWLKNTRYIIATKAVLHLDEVFLHELSRKVYKNTTFSHFGVLYAVPGALVEKKIKIRFELAYSLNAEAFNTNVLGQPELLINK